MTKLHHLKGERAAAGRRYAAAAQEYVDAWIEVHALDGINDIRDGANHGFGGVPVVLGHADFLPDPSAVTRDPETRSQERREHHRRKSGA